MAEFEGLVEGAKVGGTFEIGEGRTILGELTISGLETSLYLHDGEFFFIDDAAAGCFRGTLHNRIRVSVLDCVVRSGIGTSTRDGESFNFAELLPGYVTWGSCHLPVDVPAITWVGFHVDDAETIFHDFDAMGRVIDPEPLIAEVVGANARRIGREIPTGPEAEIFYFAGRTELADIETAIGRVRVVHRPFPFHPLSTRHAGMQNRTFVELSFSDPQFLSDALDRVLVLLRFLAMLGGRSQSIDGIRIDMAGDGRARPLDLYWTHRPRRPAEWEVRSPHPAEILIPVVEEPEEFATVLARWVAQDASRLDARVRFANAFGNQRSFTIDRLVGSANMFDILPDDAFPPVDPLSEDVTEAKAEARRIFRRLPPSPERESVLGALGRLGRATLRSRLRHRAGIVSRALPEPLTDLDVITDEAIKCRNHYVHGSPGSFSYAENGDIVTFLTSALEFIFAASDLIDAGWRIDRWREGGGILAHPFSEVLHGWDMNAERIRELREGAAETEET